MKKNSSIKAMLLTAAVLLGSQSVTHAEALLYAVDSSRTSLNNGTISEADTVKSDSSKLSSRSDAKAAKSWIEFDLSGVDVGSLTSARVRLTLHNPKDNTCQLSAINDSVTTNYVSLDGTVTWNTGPGNYTSADGVSPDNGSISTNDLRVNLDTNLTTLVGTIDYSDGDGGLAGDQFFSADVLPILQADTDGYVLFAIHGAGGSTDFATHDNAGGADYWPALELGGLGGSVTGGLYNVQLNFGDGTEPTYAGPANIGNLGDEWNNPVWVGVSSNPPITNLLFSSEVVLDSTGTDNGVTATLTASANDGLDWDDASAHIFYNYTSRDEGSPNPAALINREINVKSGVDLTLSLSGLPTNTAAAVYVYGSGNGAGSGASWSIAVTNQSTNGASSAATAYNGLVDGRDVTLTNNQGSCWEVLSAITDEAGNLTVNIAPNGGGQISLQGIQVELDLPVPPEGPTEDPVIESIDVSGTTVTLTWTDEGIGTYTIQSNPDLTTTNWADELSGLPAGLGTTNVTSGADQLFYRIKGE